MGIGIVIGSVREGRLGASVGDWVADRAHALDKVLHRLVDLTRAVTADRAVTGN